jgi:hypothetical protein
VVTSIQDGKYTDGFCVNSKAHQSSRYWKEWEVHRCELYNQGQGKTITLTERELKIVVKARGAE